MKTIRKEKGKRETVQGSDCWLRPPSQESVLARLLALPVVDGAFTVIERAYSSSKHVHPVVCSVCEVYETGAKVATSLAVLSIQPAIHRLEPQRQCLSLFLLQYETIVQVMLKSLYRCMKLIFTGSCSEIVKVVAVNKLACKGLDRLEENIPALQYPPDKLASSIAEVISSTVTVAKDSITSPIARTSDRVLGVALDSYQLTRRALGDTVDYLLSSRPARLAAEGVDVFISVTENLVDYILPPAQDEKGRYSQKLLCSQLGKSRCIDHRTSTLTENRLAKPENDKNPFFSQEKQLSCVGGKIFSPKGKRNFLYRRLEALASTVWRRAYDQTATQLRRTKSQGQELVMWVPGVAPLTSLARKNLEFAGGVLQAVPSSVSGLLFGGTEEQKDKEKKKKKEGELLQSDEVQGLVSSLGHQLQNAYTSVVSSVRSAPEVTAALAKDTAGALVETWSSVLKNVSHYIPVSHFQRPPAVFDNSIILD
ncbi:PLIN1 protein, partial [Atractosteus spatula]|nr:PLIN1 protein [Atractosteus spatula]